MLGFAAFYVYELAVGQGSDAGRVVMSAITILVGAAGLPRWPRLARRAALAADPDDRLGPAAAAGGDQPVQAGRMGLGWLVLVLALVTLGAAFTARVPDVEFADPE